MRARATRNRDCETVEEFVLWPHRKRSCFFEYFKNPLRIEDSLPGHVTLSARKRLARARLRSWNRNLASAAGLRFVISILFVRVMKANVFTARATCAVGILAIARMVPLASAQHRRQYQEEAYGPPAPYAYSYTTQDVEGTSSAEQSSDGSGRVVGKYAMQLADGRQRVVSYWADQSGFHADVVTNELGTESKDPADVTLKSSAITGYEAALRYGDGGHSQRYRGGRATPATAAAATALRSAASLKTPVLAPTPVAAGFAALKPIGYVHKSRAA